MRNSVRLSALIALSLALGIADQSPTLDSLTQTSLSTIDGSVTVPGLRDEVSVIRDEWGVPHIYARSIDDLFFAQRYVLAQSCNSHAASQNTVPPKLIGVEIRIRGTTCRSPKDSMSRKWWLRTMR